MTLRKLVGIIYQPLAIDVSDLKVHNQLDWTAPLALSIVALSALAIICVLGAIFISTRKQKRRSTTPSGTHSGRSAKDYWLERIDEVIRQYHEGSLDYAQACTQLAYIARSFASAQTAVDFSSQTLADLKHLSTGSASEGLRSVKMTISALYPAEFADLTQQGREIHTIEQAGNWVANVIERWHA